MKMGGIPSADDPCLPICWCSFQGSAPLTLPSARVPSWLLPTSKRNCRCPKSCINWVYRLGCAAAAPSGVALVRCIAATVAAVLSVRTWRRTSCSVSPRSVAVREMSSTCGRRCTACRRVRRPWTWCALSGWNRVPARQRGRGTVKERFTPSADANPHLTGTARSARRRKVRTVPTARHHGDGT